MNGWPCSGTQTVRTLMTVMGRLMLRQLPQPQEPQAGALLALPKSPCPFHLPTERCIAGHPR